MIQNFRLGCFYLRHNSCSTPIFNVLYPLHNLKRPILFVNLIKVASGNGLSKLLRLTSYAHKQVSGTIANNANLKSPYHSCHKAPNLK